MQNTQEVSIIRQEQVLYSHFFPGALFTETHTVPREERSLEEITHELLLNPTAYAFRIEEIILATVMVDGRSVQLASLPIKSLLTYVGGTLYTIEELHARLSEYPSVIENLRDVGAVRIIHTRSGHWLPFRESDQFLAEPDDDAQQENLSEPTRKEMTQ